MFGSESGVEISSLTVTQKVDNRELRRGFQEGEKLTKDYVGKTNSILGTMGTGVQASSGLLSNLSHIANIIQAIPAIGQLGSALIRPLTDAAEAGIKFNAQLESARIGFTSITGDSQKTEAHLKRLFDFAAKTPFEFTGLLAASRYMNVFGIQLDDQIPKLKVWGDVIAASGQFSEDAVMGVVRAFGQMTSKGRLSGEEMEQLAERGFPAWELLAKAIGKTVGETRKLSELGKLKGRESVEAITAMAAIDPRFQNQMEKQSQTFLGRMSNVEDLKARASGMATENLFNDLNTSLEAALKQGGTVEALAQSINRGIAPVSGLVKVAAVGFLGGGITAGITEGIQAGKDLVQSAVVDLGMGVISSFAKTLGIESPSKVFYDFGMMSALGFKLGFQDEIQKGQGTKITTREGDTPRKIAERLGIPLEQLMQRFPQGRVNADDPIDAGQQIFVPNRIDHTQRRRRGVRMIGADIEAIIDEAARQYSVDPSLIRAMMTQESGGKVGAISPKGARGLMQLMPGTARAYGVANIFDPRQNIFGGVHYMADLLKEFGGDVPLALAGYNAGAGAVHKFGKKIPPYNETQNYVRSIMSRYQRSGATGGAFSLLNFNEFGFNDIVGGADGLTALRDKEKELIRNVSRLNDELGKHADYFADMNARARGIGVQFQPETQKVIDDLQRARAELADVRTQIAQAQAAMRAAQERKLAASALRGQMPSIQLPEPGIGFTGMLPTRDLFSGAGLEASLYKAQLAFHNITDELPPIMKGVNDITDAEQKATLGAGGWFKTVYDGGGDVLKRLKEIKNSTQTLGEQYQNFLVKTPEGIGHIFGNAVRESDGTLKGFGRSIAVGFADALKEASAQIVENLITRGVSSVMARIFEPSTNDVVAALDKQFEGVPLLTVGFETNTTAVTVNTTSTDLNTAAINQLTAAMLQQSAGLASAGAAGGQSFWGQLAMAALSGLLGGIGGGGDAGSGSGGYGEVTGYTINPPTGHARGGLVASKTGGHLIRVAEGGYDELVLSTNPSLKERTSKLLAEFMERTNIAPKFAIGGWTDGMDWRSIANFTNSSNDYNYAPNYNAQHFSNQSHSQEAQAKHLRVKLELAPQRSPNSYYPKRSTSEMLEYALKKIEDEINGRW